MAPSFHASLQPHSLALPSLAESGLDRFQPGNSKPTVNRACPRTVCLCSFSCSFVLSVRTGLAFPTGGCETHRTQLDHEAILVQPTH